MDCNCPAYDNAPYDSVDRHSVGLTRRLAKSSNHTQPVFSYTNHKVSSSSKLYHRPVIQVAAYSLQVEDMRLYLMADADRLKSIPQTSLRPL
jgi:hypothetical protein